MLLSKIWQKGYDNAQCMLFKTDQTNSQTSQQKVAKTESNEKKEITK